MKIAVLDVSKRFGEFAALDRVNLDIRSGELLALLGPSGSGKTTLLRILAGLDWPDQGEVQFDGVNALSRSVRERNVGFVFQHYALFRHMNVFENVAFGLRARPRRRRLSEPEICARVKRLLDLVQLDWLADRYPNQLSGGQRQRVALARALAIEPRVLLLDEPFGALDAKVRKELRRWLRTLHSEIHVTSVFVTHDQEEALEVADRVVVMDRGRIEQTGSAQEVYERPGSPFVHEFIGESVIVPVTVEDSRICFEGEALALDPHGLTNGSARLYVRPYEMQIVPAGEGCFSGTIRRVHGIGARRRVEIALARSERMIEVDAARIESLEPGRLVGLTPRQYRIFAAS
ncbi:MAG TPA: sulfate/molybdate ABC transporter ATP-binding protein [Xanthobacteraceae bacterium]|jgi:sulfate transport system ATP-binding protein|nr:sulfate/molybdate ABC transporter ATP-binding protein [Xanthobacteraceae bacterium]